MLRHPGRLVKLETLFPLSAAGQKLKGTTRDKTKALLILHDLNIAKIIDDHCPGRVFGLPQMERWP